MLNTIRLIIVFLTLATISLVVVRPCQAAPKDPPVDTGGEGLFGDDWTDYGTATISTLWYRRSDTNHRAIRLLVTISSTNSNFDSNHCRTSAQTDFKVEHIHFNKDYGSDFGGTDGTVTAAEGKAFFDWTYDGYSPQPTGGTGATGTTNCRSHAYHGYKSATTKSNNWVNAGPGSKYYEELFEIASLGDNGGFPTIKGDRCDDQSNHVWVVKEPDPEQDPCVSSAATSIEWKNNSSGIYTWSPGSPTNDAPRGDPPGNNFYEEYGIYNKTDR
jgi:hypothetical protein